MKRPRREDPAQLTLFAFSRVERSGVDAQGNPTYRVVQEAPEAWLRPKRVARALGVNVRTIYGWINSGAITADEWQRRGPKIIYIAAGAVKRLKDTGDK